MGSSCSRPIVVAPKTPAAAGKVSNSDEGTVCAGQPHHPSSSLVTFSSPLILQSVQQAPLHTAPAAARSTSILSQQSGRLVDSNDTIDEDCDSEHDGGGVDYHVHPPSNMLAQFEPELSVDSGVAAATEMSAASVFETPFGSTSLSQGKMHSMATVSMRSVTLRSADSAATAALDVSLGSLSQSAQFVPTAAFHRPTDSLPSLPTPPTVPIDQRAPLPHLAAAGVGPLQPRRTSRGGIVVTPRRGSVMVSLPSALQLSPALSASKSPRLPSRSRTQTPTSQFSSSVEAVPVRNVSPKQDARRSESSTPTTAPLTRCSSPHRAHTATFNLAATPKKPTSCSTPAPSDLGRSLHTSNRRLASSPPVGSNLQYLPHPPSSAASSRHEEESSFDESIAAHNNSSLGSRVHFSAAAFLAAEEVSVTSGELISMSSPIANGTDAAPTSSTRAPRILFASPLAQPRTTVHSLMEPHDDEIVGEASSHLAHHYPPEAVRSGPTESLLLSNSAASFRLPPAAVLNGSISSNYSMSRNMDTDGGSSQHLDDAGNEALPVGVADDLMEVDGDGDGVATSQSLGNSRLTLTSSLNRSSSCSSRDLETSTPAVVPPPSEGDAMLGWSPPRAPAPARGCLRTWQRSASVDSQDTIPVDTVHEKSEGIGAITSQSKKGPSPSPKLQPSPPQGITRDDGEPSSVAYIRREEMVLPSSLSPHDLVASPPGSSPGSSQPPQETLTSNEDTGGGFVNGPSATNIWIPVVPIDVSRKKYRDQIAKPKQQSQHTHTGYPAR